MTSPQGDQNIQRQGAAEFNRRGHVIGLREIDRHGMAAPGEVQRIVLSAMQGGRAAPKIVGRQCGQQRPLRPKGKALLRLGDKGRGCGFQLVARRGERRAAGHQGGGFRPHGLAPPAAPVASRPALREQRGALRSSKFDEVGEVFVVRALRPHGLLQRMLMDHRSHADGLDAAQRSFAALRLNSRGRQGERFGSGLCVGRRPCEK